MNRVRIAFALSACLILASAHSLLADVKADEKALVKFEGALGRVVNIFGGKAAREGVKSTVAVKGDRKISASDQTGQIVDLREEKVYDLDIRRKTYKVTTFAELRRRMEEARKKAEEDARKARAEDKDKSDAPPDQSGKEMEIDFSVKETGQKKNINGFDTHEAIMTIALREKGKTLEQGGGLVIASDIWLAPRIAAMREIAEFELRYAKQLAGPMMAGASAEEMAAALAMYPMLQEGLARMRTEGAKLEGTAILTTTTVESVKSAEQLASEQKQQAEPDNSRSGASGGVGGLVGGLARRAAQRRQNNDQVQNTTPGRSTFMTTTNEVLKVSTDVSAADVAIPEGFKENK
jgi:hypothetical protein